MSTTLFAAFGILAPMHGLLRRLTAAKPPAARISFPVSPHPAQLPVAPAAELVHYSRVRPAVRSRSRANPPLRVVRVMESGQATAHGGRMMISGRMADVCAELDRMAEREASVHAGN